MSRLPIPTALTLVAALALGSAGALAQQNPYTKAPPAMPMSRPHQQALLSNDPDACSKAVEKSMDDVSMRIQGKEGMETRTTKNALLQAARNAAAAGDNEGCWHWYDKVSNFVR